MRKIALLAFSFFTLFTAHAQTSFGLKAGVNLANQVKTNSNQRNPSFESTTAPAFGYQVGAFYKARLTRQLLVSAEANFSLVGSKVTLISPDYQWYDAREKLGFIELPLTIQY